MRIVYHLAALAYLVQLALLIGLHARGDYDPVSDAISDYGVGATKIQFTIYWSVGIIAATLVAIAILADVRLPARGGFYLLASTNHG
ncbi:MAG: hypothetical protein AB7E81_03325 [Hyphomicrobiaceae bacterium]